MCNVQHLVTNHTESQISQEQRAALPSPFTGGWLPMCSFKNALLTHILSTLFSSTSVLFSCAPAGNLQHGSGMQQIVSTDDLFLSTSKRLDCIHVNTWVWPCCHNIQLWTPSVLYFAPADDPIFHVDKITNVKWMISSPLVCLFHPLCHSLLQVFQCSRMCILKLETMLSYPVCRSHCRRCCATK